LYDAQVDNTLWTGPRWRLLVSANLPAAWTPNLLCPLQLSSRTVEFPVSQFPWSRRSISSWGRSAVVVFLLSRRHNFTVHTPHTHLTPVLHLQVGN